MLFFNALYEPCLTTMDYARMDRAARIIQNAWEDYRQRKLVVDHTIESESGMSDGSNFKKIKPYIGTAIMNKKRGAVEKRLKSALTAPNLAKLGLGDGPDERRTSVIQLASKGLGHFRRSLDSLLTIGMQETSVQKATIERLKAEQKLVNKRMMNKVQRQAGKNLALEKSPKRLQLGFEINKSWERYFFETNFNISEKELNFL